MSETVYLVQRLTLDSYSEHYLSYGEQSVPVRMFFSREQAVQCCVEMEAKAREELVPFNFIDLRYDVEKATSLSLDDLLSQLTEMGLPEPEKEERYGNIYCDWDGWWKSQVGSVTAEQIARLWNLFDRVHFYQVVPSNLDH